MCTKKQIFQYLKDHFRRGVKHAIIRGRKAEEPMPHVPRVPPPPPPPAPPQAPNTKRVEVDTENDSIPVPEKIPMWKGKGNAAYDKEVDPEEKAPRLSINPKILLRPSLRKKDREENKKKEEK